MEYETDCHTILGSLESSCNTVLNVANIFTNKFHNFRIIRFESESLYTFCVTCMSIIHTFNFWSHNKGTCRRALEQHPTFYTPTFPQYESNAQAEPKTHLVLMLPSNGFRVPPARSLPHRYPTESFHLRRWPSNHSPRLPHQSITSRQRLSVPVEVARPLRVGRGQPTLHLAAGLSVIRPLRERSSVKLVRNLVLSVYFVPLK